MYSGQKLFGQKFNFSDGTPLPMCIGRKEQPTKKLTINNIPTVKFGVCSVLCRKKKEKKMFIQIENI